VLVVLEVVVMERLLLLQLDRQELLVPAVEAVAERIQILQQDMLVMVDLVVVA
jgi:hypothetical protein